MSHYEPINLTYYDPNNSFFKPDRSAREEYTLYECCNKENCDAYKRKKCVMLNGFGHKCPYGRKSTEVGYTKSAKRYGDLIYQAKEKYGDVSYALDSLNFLCKIGDYVYLNLLFLANYVNPIRPHDFFIDKDIIKKEDFTPEFIVELIKYRPRGLFNCVEIGSYQEKEVPTFCNQLKKYFPEMYQSVKGIYPEIESFIQNIDYKGMYAKVKTLLPGDVRLSINTLEWDGECIRGKGNQISFWRLNTEDVIIIPNNDTYVEIVNNDTVTDDTEFKDE